MPRVPPPLPSPASRVPAPDSSPYLPHMPTSPYRVLICDIDGCLCPEDNSPMDTHTLARIADYNLTAARDHDRPQITLCSGRPVTAVEMMTRIIANDTIPCVAEMGVWIFDPASGRFDMDPAITDDHKQAVRDAQRWAEADLVPAGTIIQPGKHASISLHHKDNTHLHTTITDQITARTEQERWPLRISATWNWINWDLAHISKASGIDRLLERTGLARPQLAGIGDTMSDLAIQQHVDFFAVPQNAKEDLKPHASMVAAKTEAKGVLEILESLITP